MTDYHDQTTHFFSEAQIKQVLYSVHSILEQSQRDLLKEEILAARHDGKISLFQLHHVLKGLREGHKISPYDQEAVEEAIGKLFEN